jgi:Arc/MetJ-type ribon-helix-helix transcriptional regulator
MAKSIAVKHKKKRGRPATGHDPFVGIRLPEELLVQIAKWSENSEAGSRSEAIRRLIELGLTVKTPARHISKPGRKLRAQELATKAIEKIIDPSAPPEERAQRRRLLTKGPPEFREDRVDLPKAKK